MIDPGHPLPVARQAKLLSLSRSSVYYHPRPVSDGDLALMRRIDALHLDHPFAGSRMLRDMLKLAGYAVGRKHIGYPDEENEYRGSLSPSQQQQARQDAPYLPVFAAPPQYRPPQSGLGDGHHLPSDEERLCLPDGGSRLGDP